MRCLTILFVLALYFSLYPQGRIEQTINDNWIFTRENVRNAEKNNYKDGYWEKVSLPHTWNSKDGQDGGNNYYRGIGWYRRNLFIPENVKDKIVVLKFDASSIVSTLFINGKTVGTHKGAFGAFSFDVTSFIDFGKNNLLAVKVNNCKDTTVPPLRGDFTMFGGIYRNVHLVYLDKISFSPFDYSSSGIYIKQSNVSENSADIEVLSKVFNNHAVDKDFSLRIKISGANGELVTEQTFPFKAKTGVTEDYISNFVIKNPHLWNGLSDPYLYSVNLQVVVGNTTCDEITEPLGIRYFKVDPANGFYLNGKPYPLHGVNKHQDFMYKGWGTTSDDLVTDMKYLKEIGANTVRLAHYQHPKEFYTLCDKAGLVVWAELALVDEINPSPDFRKNCLSQLNELIKQNYNHPSIVFWSLQNELMNESDTAHYTSVIMDLNNLAKTLDPGRLTTVASRSRFNLNEGMNSVTDVIGYNVYRGWYEKQPEDFALFIDEVHNNYPQRCIAISEYGAGARVDQHEIPPKKHNTKGPFHPEEWQSYLHEVTYKAMLERKYIWGTYIWNMFDFASDGRDEGDYPGMNDKGLVTYDRTIKKDAFYWYKCNWNPEPMIYITSKRYAVRNDRITEVKVYCNQDNVSLFINNQEVGTKSSTDKIFTWKDIALKEGKNVIKVVSGKLEDTCEWVLSSPETLMKTE